LKKIVVEKREKSPTLGLKRVGEPVLIETKDGLFMSVMLQQISKIVYNGERD